MNELHELLRQQASYAELVMWMQKREKCQYMQACLKLNQELKKYRSHFSDLQEQSATGETTESH